MMELDPDITAALDAAERELAPLLLEGLFADLAPVAKTVLDRSLKRADEQFWTDEPAMRRGWAWRGRIDPLAEGPLSGREVVVKDSICVAGLPVTLGDLSRPALMPEKDAIVVERIRRAGATIIGKSQCEDFCQGGQSFSSAPVPVENPHDRTRSAGGSSSGSAALVGAGEVELALAADSAGSVRIPSAYCGCVGLKPTRGALSFDGIFSLEPLLETAGPIARTVDDCALLFGAMRGDNTERPEHKVPVRIAMLEEGFGTRGGEGVADIVRAGIDRAFPHAGTVSIGSAHNDAAGVHLALYVSGMARTLRGLGLPSGTVSGHRVDMAEAEALWLEDAARQSSELRLMRAALPSVEERFGPRFYFAAAAQIQALIEHYDALFADCDVLVMPTTLAPPPRIPLPDTPLAERIAASFSGTENTAPFNLTGHPAISVPCGKVDGLPVGVMLVARRGHENDLFQAARQIEETS